ncbi:MAG: hypothetical protein L3K08_05450 [Thermoplasmata archaeon]|nr:hypothetical protein [Thermoplasmata archaeon]
MDEPPHTLRQILEEFLFKEDLQELCEGQGMGIDGSREDLISRLVGDADFDHRKALRYLDRPQLVEISQRWGLDDSGKLDPLRARVLREIRSAPRPSEEPSRT